MASSFIPSDSVPTSSNSSSSSGSLPTSSTSSDPLDSKLFKIFAELVTKGDPSDVMAEKSVRVVEIYKQLKQLATLECQFEEQRSVNVNNRDFLFSYRAQSMELRKHLDRAKKDFGKTVEIEKLSGAMDHVKKIIKGLYKPVDKSLICHDPVRSAFNYAFKSEASFHSLAPVWEGHSRVVTKSFFYQQKKSLQELLENSLTGSSSYEERENLLTLLKFQENIIEMNDALFSDESLPATPEHVTKCIANIQEKVANLELPQLIGTLNLGIINQKGWISFGIPGGWKGHFVGYEFKKSPEGEYYFVIHNRGEGSEDLSLHGNTTYQIGNKRYRQTSVAIKVPKEALHDENFLKEILESRLNESESSRVYTAIYTLIETYGGEIMRSENQDLLSLIDFYFSPQEIPKSLQQIIQAIILPDKHYHSLQLFGTCVISNWQALIKGIVSSQTLKALKIHTINGITLENRAASEVRMAPLVQKMFSAPALLEPEVLALTEKEALTHYNLQLEVIYREMRISGHNPTLLQSTLKKISTLQAELKKYIASASLIESRSEEGTKALAGLEKSLSIYLTALEERHTLSCRVSMGLQKKLASLREKQEKTKAEEPLNHDALKIAIENAIDIHYLSLDLSEFTQKWLEHIEQSQNAFKSLKEVIDASQKKPAKLKSAQVYYLKSLSERNARFLKLINSKINKAIAEENFKLLSSLREQTEKLENLSKAFKFFDQYS